MSHITQDFDPQHTWRDPQHTWPQHILSSRTCAIKLGNAQKAHLTSTDQACNMPMIKLQLHYTHENVAYAYTAQRLP